MLPPDLLRRLTDPRSTLPGARPADYALAAGERLNESITQSWNRLRTHWAEFRTAAANLSAGMPGTGLTNDKWSLPLLRELGFGLLPATAGPEIGGRTYAVRRCFGPAPIHLIGCGLSLDRRAAGQRGAAAANPHGLVQDLLNRDDARLWGVVSNGLRLRILRDNQALSRQSWLEFDLEAMFSGEVYADFVLLWLVAHATRFAPQEDDRPETCWMEQWTREAERQGLRALGALRGSVVRVLQILGGGFTGHPRNGRLREALRRGTVTLGDFHGQLLRVVYRLIFLFVAEDRLLDGQPLLHPPNDSDAARMARERYAAHYGTARLRELAGRIRGSRHGDLWRQFQLLVGALSGDPDFETTRRALALPALGSVLWDPAATAELNDAHLTNYDFLESLRCLAFVRHDRVLRPVDYRNLGAEELGGVYESLLGLTPQLNGDGARFTFAEFAGNVRKTSGSYYTPDELVQCLLDSALDPVVAEAVRNQTGADAERAILDLKVCDPAVGSGHFLVGAAHRLARHLARVRAHAAGDGEPSPLLYQRALRDVIGRCLYGVDVNPMAAELCRVGLWLEALEPGKPLSFLDHHVRVGDSLLGATPELIAAGLPDEAFQPLKADDRTVCSVLRKRNRLERESGQQDMRRLMVAEPRPEYGSLASLSRDLDESADGTLDDIRRKEVRFRSLVVSPQYRRRQLVADAWCAAFVWPKQAGDDPACFTTDTMRSLHDDADSPAPAQHRAVERLARRYRFFHWELAFPEVFENGGFDCVLGNPPWEHVELVEKEWFAERKPEIANAATAAARKQMIRSLEIDHPALYSRFLDAQREFAGRRHLLRNSGRYPLCGRRRIDLYTVFAEAMRSFLNERGRVGCVVPTGIVTDDTTKLFFQDVMDTRSLVSLLDFENHQRRFFPDVRSDKKFCLFTAGRGLRPIASRAEFVFFARAVEETDDPNRRFVLSSKDIALLNPNTRTCPIFRTRADAELAKAVYRRVPVLVREVRDRPDDNPWRIRFGTMFNMASDSELFRTRAALEADGWGLVDNVFYRDDGEYLPLYEAKMIHQFDHRWAGHHGEGDRSDRRAFAKLSLADKQNPAFTVLPCYWVDARKVWSRNPRIGVTQGTSSGWLMGCRDITANTDRRTVICGVFPYSAVGHELPVWTASAAHAESLPSVLSSFACDFVARLKLGGKHLSFFVAKQMAVLSPTQLRRYVGWLRVPGGTTGGATVLDWLIPRALELTYTAYHLEPFARECGWKGPPFRWDDERRFQLRCELDAAFFHLYLPSDDRGDWKAARRVDGCPHDETPGELEALRAHFSRPRDAVAYIMDTFPVVRRKEEKEFREYRTKRVILEMYDAMQEAVAAGESYQTRLDPPPADPSVCHPPRAVAREVAPPVLADLPDGAWVGPAAGDRTDQEIAVLAAVLKAVGAAAPSRRVRLAALLAIEPRLLTPSLTETEAADWRRLVGRDAEPLPRGVSRLRRPEYAWGEAVGQLRGAGDLVEDLDAKTWAPGSALDAVETRGWPDGRVRMVLDTLRRRGDEEIVRTLPETVRAWIDAAA